MSLSLRKIYLVAHSGEKGQIFLEIPDLRKSQRFRPRVHFKAELRPVCMKHPLKREYNDI